jgi:hypothetical protein
VKDTQGRIHLLHGDPGVGQPLSDSGTPLCYHAALSLDNGALVHLCTSDNFDFIPFSEAEKLSIASLVEGYCQIFFEAVPRLEQAAEE